MAHSQWRQCHRPCNRAAAGVNHQTRREIDGCISQSPATGIAGTDRQGGDRCSFTRRLIGYRRNRYRTCDDPGEVLRSDVCSIRRNNRHVVRSRCSIIKSNRTCDGPCAGVNLQTSGQAFSEVMLGATARRTDRQRNRVALRVALVARRRQRDRARRADRPVEIVNREVRSVADHDCRGVGADSRPPRAHHARNRARTRVEAQSGRKTPGDIAHRAGAAICGDELQRDGVANEIGLVAGIGDRDQTVDVPLETGAAGIGAIADADRREVRADARIADRNRSRDSAGAGIDGQSRGRSRAA